MDQFKILVAFNWKGLGAKNELFAAEMRSSGGSSGGEGSTGSRCCLKAPQCIQISPESD